MAKDVSDDGTERATAGEVQKMIPPKQLKKLLNDQETAQENIDEIKGTAGNAAKQAIEKWGINADALRVIRRLRKKLPERLADFMDHFLYMYDVSGLADRAKSAPKFSQMDVGEEAPDKQEPKPGANVTQLHH